MWALQLAGRTVSLALLAHPHTTKLTLFHPPISNLNSNLNSFGSRTVHIIGSGFAVDTYGGSNKLFIGVKGYDDFIASTVKEAFASNDDLTHHPWITTQNSHGTPWNPSQLPPPSLWIEAPVIEGACTVDCGGARKLVADTSTIEHLFSISSPFALSFMSRWSLEFGSRASYETSQGWRPEWWLRSCESMFCGEDVTMDVKVVTLETSDSTDSFDEFVAYLPSAYTYAHPLNPTVPYLTSLSPRYGSSSDVFRLQGTNLGTSLKDYRNIYFGPGRPPMGSNLESFASSALCRPSDLNPAADKDGEVYGTFQAVTVDQQTDYPIRLDEVICRLGDFEGGSYNASAYMGVDPERRPGSSKAGAGYVGGLTSLFPHSATDLLSVGGEGVPFSAQYYPHINSIYPAMGSKGGGTILTITGGGFSMDEAKNDVTVGGSTCRVIESTIEFIVCETSREESEFIVKDYYAEPFVREVRGANATNATNATKATNETYFDYLSWEMEMAMHETETEMTAPVELGWEGAVTHGEGWQGGGIYHPAPHPTTNFVTYDFNSSLLTRSGMYGVEVTHVAVADVDDDECDSLSTQPAAIDIVVASGAVTRVGNASQPLTIAFSPLSGSMRVTVAVSLTGDSHPHECLPTPIVTVTYLSPAPFNSPSQACTDPKAANFDAGADAALGGSPASCLYAKGRGLSVQSYSYMKPGYSSDDWFPQGSPSETMYSHESCLAPNGWGWQAEYDETCDDGACPLHDPCGPKAFCCLGDHFASCTSTWDVPGTSGSSPWRTMLVQDVGTAEEPCYFDSPEQNWGEELEEGGAFTGAKGKYMDGNTTFLKTKCNSYLDEFESMRQSSSGYFQLELCFEDSDWGCVRWFQTCNPMLEECTVENSGFVADDGGGRVGGRRSGR